MPIILCIPDRTLAFIIMKNCCIFVGMKNKKTDQETMEDIAASNSSNFLWSTTLKSEVYSFFATVVRKSLRLSSEKIGKKFSRGGGVMIWKNSRAFTRLINFLKFKAYVLICNCVQFQCLKHIHTSRKITVAERYVDIKISERKMCFEICCKL